MLPAFSLPAWEETEAPHLVLICIYRLMNGIEGILLEFRAYGCVAVSPELLLVLYPLCRYRAQKSLFKETQIPEAEPGLVVTALAQPGRFPWIEVLTEEAGFETTSKLSVR